MRFIIVLSLLFLLQSCDTFNTTVPEVSTETQKKEKFVPDMYQPSEMTALMLYMYDANEHIKKEILAGNTPDKFPKDFLNIFTAELTDSKPHNETFKAYSQVFIDNERAIFDTASKLPIKQRYNNAINTCIMCHTTECVGPIPRIKKLLIN